MSTISTATRTLEPTPDQIAQVQAALEQLVRDPHALALARLQHIMNLAQTHEHIRELLHAMIAQLNQQVRELGHAVI